MGLAGVYGGYFGGALGVVMLAFLSLTTGEGIKQLNVMKTVLCLAGSSATAVMFSVYGPVRWGSALLAAPGVLAGGFAGARVARRMNPGLLRWSVVLLGLAVGLYLLTKD